MSDVVLLIEFNVMVVFALFWGHAVIKTLDEIRDQLAKVPEPEVQVEVPQPQPVAASSSIPMEPPRRYIILKRQGDDWTVVGKRTQGHPDIKEAIDTPRLAVKMPDGTIEYGVQ